MTREEAIYELKNAAWLGTDHSRARTEEAVEMAIQALSQEPCDDAISRDAVIKLFNGNIGSESALILHMVKKLPSVTQKSGKWEDLHRCWVCSECGQQTHIEHKYCPNCGAKMESEDKE